MEMRSELNAEFRHDVRELGVRKARARGGWLGHGSFFHHDDEALRKRWSIGGRLRWVPQRWMYGASMDGHGDWHGLHRSALPQKPRFLSCPLHLLEKDGKWGSGHEHSKHWRGLDLVVLKDGS